jgi:hypothetical protein
MPDLGPWFERRINEIEAEPAASSAIEVAPGRRVFVVQSTAGVVEGVYSSEANAQSAFTHWQHLEIREGIMDYGIRPSVVPGEAQRKCGRCKAAITYNPITTKWHGSDDIAVCHERFGPNEHWHDPAVPSEVAPSRERRLEDALRNNADQTLADGTKCYCLEERMAKGYKCGEVGGEHMPWCIEARSVLEAK